MSDIENIFRGRAEVIKAMRKRLNPPSSMTDEEFERVYRGYSWAHYELALRCEELRRTIKKAIRNLWDNLLIKIKH